MNLRNNFPVLNNTTYLNTSASGILYDSLIRWRQEHDLAYLEQGSGFRLHQAEFLEGVRDSIAQFFKADRTFTYLPANFSYGYNVFLDGLTADPSFLLLENEYPSVYYPVKSRGFRYHTLPQGDQLEERIIEALLLFKPTVFVFSMVQYTNGLKMDLNFLRDLKQLFPDLLLIADGTQYCGTEHFDFGSSPLDVLMASGYKWMLGGYGNAIALLKESIAYRLYADAQQRPLPEEPFLKHKDRLALRFEPGHQDTLAFGTLQYSLSFLTQTGFTFIEQQNAALLQQARTAFSERGLLDDFLVKRKVQSTIMKLNIDEPLALKIQADNIACTWRGTGLRVSFHFYNNEDDLNHLLEVIDKNR